MRESWSLRGRLLATFFVLFLFVIFCIIILTNIHPALAARIRPSVGLPTTLARTDISASPDGLQATEVPARTPSATITTLATESSAVTRFVVTTTLDDVDAHPGDGICASRGGECTLRAAIQEANADADASLILLPKGIFSIDIPGSGEDAGASGDFDVLSDITINGAGEDLTILSGEGLDRVLDIGKPGQIGVPVTISNLTVQDGTDNGTNAPGGVRIRSFTVLLERVAVIDHIGEGIGVYEGELTLNDSRVSGNVGIGVGGIRAGASALWISRSSIDNNSGAWGGLSSDTRLVMSASTVSGNRGTTGPGGMHLSGSALITNSTISGNEGSEGGGLWADQGEMMLLNTTVTNNQARGSGGDWHSGTGGGIYFQGSRGSILLQNSILAGNRASSGKAECAGNLSSGGYNLFGDLQGCGLDPLKSDLARRDPLLRSLQDNGGATLTHALLPESPAADGGDPDGCKTSEGGLIRNDQRGEPRPSFAGPVDKKHTGEARCDIGAYEEQDLAPSPTKPAPQLTETRPAIRATAGFTPVSSIFKPTWILITPLGPATFAPAPRPINLPTLRPVVAVTPAGSPTGSSAPPVGSLPLPPNCRQAIRNGGFEESGGWTFPATEFSAVYDLSQVHSGVRSARTGILSPLQNRYSYSSVWQPLSIPEGTQQATLAFWAYPYNSGPIEDYAGGDRQLALLAAGPVWEDLRSPVLETLMSTRSDSRAWTYYQFDLTKYAGQAVWLYFGTYNNGWAASWGSPMALFVDDVSLILCQP